MAPAGSSVNNGRGNAPRNLGPPPDLRWLPPGRLGVDPGYQRTLDSPRSQKLIAKIAAEFDWLKFGALTSVPAGAGAGDGNRTVERWTLLDGRRRNAAALLVPIAEVPVLVHRAASFAEQAGAFVAANRDRVPMSAQALFHARLAAGDADATTVKRLCDLAGIRLLRSNKAAAQFPAGATAAVPALLCMVKYHGEAVAGVALRIFAKLYGREPGALRGPYLFGASRFLYQGGGAAGLTLGLRRLGLDGMARAAAHGNGTQAGASSVVRVLRAAVGINEAEAQRQSAGEPVRGAMHPHIPRPITPRRDKAASVPAPKQIRREQLRQPAEASAYPGRPPAPADQARIDEFIARRGARLVMAPEQVAELLRHAGHRVVIEEVTTGSPLRRNAGPLRVERRPLLDGAPVTLAALYEAANALRATARLPPVEGPREVADAGVAA